MIELSQFKLREYDDIEYHVGDLRYIEFKGEYDLIISSLAMHHLQTDKEKIAAFRKIYNSLNSGGVFYNADSVQASNKYLDNVNIEQWKEFMLESLSEKEIDEVWLPTHYKEDYPAPLIKQVDWLRDVGFKEVDVTWKYIMGAVFGGVK